MTESERLMFKQAVNLLYLTSILMLSQYGLAREILRDEQGFVRCFQLDSSSETYFVEWDRYTQSTQRAVSIFTRADYVKVSGHKIKNCKDAKYLHDIPSSILKNKIELNLEIPQEVEFSMQQIEEGAHLFRSEVMAQEYIKNNKQRFIADRPEVLTRLRYEVGDRFTQEVMQEFMNQLFQKQPNCEAYIGTCDFYLCQEKKTPCGLDSYNLSFGYKYCSVSRFKLLTQMTTQLGQSWVPQTFQCLQERSLNFSLHNVNSADICAQIKKVSYESHPDCYVKAGFCDLKFSEKFKIFKTVKEDLLSSEGIDQAQAVLKMCHAQKN